MALIIMGVVVGLLLYTIKGVLYKIIIVLSVILILLLNVTSSPQATRVQEQKKSQGQKALEEIKKMTNEKNKKCDEYANNAKEVMELRQKGLYKEIIKDMFKTSNYKGLMDDVDVFLNDAFSYQIIEQPKANHLGDYSGSDIAQYSVKIYQVKERFYEKYYNKCIKN